MLVARIRLDEHQRRRSGRRDGETDNIYVDRYTRGEWFLIIGVMVLSLLDMVFTIVGSTEDAVTA